MTRLAILQARVASTRLPGKVLAPILGMPMLARQIERVARARRIDRLVVATSDTAEDLSVAALCHDLGVACHRGPLHDVLGRFYGTLQEFGGADDVVRLTADCPLADWQVIDAAVDLHLASGADYTSNAICRTYPDGLDVEVIRAGVIKQLWREARLPADREHVTTYVRNHPQEFKVAHLRQQSDLSRLRWTVDWPDHLAMVRAVFAALLPTKPGFLQEDVCALMARSPKIAALNRARCDQAEGPPVSASAALPG